jgi:hypothetical protein
MKRLQVLIFISGCLTFFPVDNAKARAWRGIIPLHSTRSDVRRLLGKPIVGGDGAIDLYELREGHVNIRYARRECEQGLPADWGNWKVPRDTVVNISIGLHQELSPAELKIRTLKPFKWYTDTSGATYYRDKRRGIEYQVQEGMVTAITYGPTARDGRLLCRKNMPLIRY